MAVCVHPPIFLMSSVLTPASASRDANVCRNGGGGIRRWIGGQGRVRTGDTRIFSPLLYQLSYLAA